MVTVGILTGAGSGARLGAGVPKALVPVGGVPMVRIAADNLFASGAVDEVVVTVPDGWQAEFAAALADIGQPLTLVTGGETRQASISNALAQVSPGCTKVLVHDAARPFAPPSLIADVANAITADTKAVIPALPVTDTIKAVAPTRHSAARSEATKIAESRRVVEVVTQTLNRESLRAVQTPQGFDRQTLEKAYLNAIGQQLIATDDAGLVEALGIAVQTIPGAESAMKITTPTDLKIAELLYT